MGKPNDFDTIQTTLTLTYSYLLAHYHVSGHHNSFENMIILVAVVASNKYPTIHHFVTEMFTYAHIYVIKWCIVEYGTGGDLCNRSIATCDGGRGGGAGRKLPLQWRHNGRDGVSNHQPHHCLLNRLFRCRSKKKIKAPRHWLLCGKFTGHRWIPCTNGQ